MIERDYDKTSLQKLIRQFPVTAIIGPRQCGKTTLAAIIHANHYFDLENPRDAARLQQAQLTLERLSGLISIDEIQRQPDLFTLLRYLSDTKHDQKYLILGSASPNLIKNSGDSLAGRIAYYRLGGLRLADVGSNSFHRHWLRGGYPPSFIAPDDEQSKIWRENYISTFLERDIPQLGIHIPAAMLRRFWTMLSHFHGQVINYSELSNSLGIADTTVKRYIDILEGTMVIRQLQPWFNNTAKRLVKRPKIYIKDSGLFHSLQYIDSESGLLNHPKLGASWEGYALEEVGKVLGKPDTALFFWATHSHAELDLFWQYDGKNYGIEFKYSGSPTITRSMRICMNDLDLFHLWIVYPGDETYILDPKITVLPLKDIGYTWKYPATV